MAMMAKMRSLAPAFILSVGALFVLFMIISDSNVLDVLGQGSNNVGSVNGQEITYAEFNRLFEQQLKSQRDQYGRDLEDAEVDQLREQVWETMITQKLIAEEIEKMGITVSDQEIRDIILSDNPPAFLKQQFIDSTGQFNRAVYEQVLKDPKNREPVLQAEDYVRQTRLSEKLQSLITASVTVSDQELRKRFTDQNINMTARYALVDITRMPDADFKVTDAELRNYFDKNLDKYSIKPQRKLKYVLFPTSPSANDSANVKASLESVVMKMKNDTSSFQSFADIYSAEPYSKDTIQANALSGEAVNLLVSSTPGNVVGPVESPQGYAVYKLIAKIPSNETMAHVTHILINQFGSDEKNLAEANKLYDRLAAGEDFAMLAQEYSADKGSAVQGGDLGWFGKGAMVPEFEKASFDSKVGEVQKPVKTSYGYHIIKVLGRTSDKFVVEKIINPVKTSATTRDAMFNAARDFEYLADKNGFEKEAEVMKYQVLETAPFLEESYSIPGIGVNKNLTNFAFNNEVGDVSPVHRVQNGYVVAKVSEVIKEGAQDFETLKEQLKPAVIKEKKMEKAKSIASDIYKKINGDLSKAPQYSQFVVLDTTGNFTGNGAIQNVGRDYAFFAKAQELQLNKVSEPFKGGKGYFMIQVLSRTPFDESAFSMQKEGLRQSILQEKKNTFFSQWLTSLKKDADIEDNRYMFYGY